MNSKVNVNPKEEGDMEVHTEREREMREEETGKRAHTEGERVRRHT